jgi:pimeloyl-ACP methyl ester carboxylesterase
MTAIAIVLGLLLGLVLISYLVELARSAPPPPKQLDWAPGIPIKYLDVNGLKLRYIVTGQGPALVLLHTLRTQLDMFQKVVPALAQRFTVYALDYPGHGYSDIPRTEYRPEVFVSAVAGFLDRLDLQRVTLAGESIGGTIALLLAARRNRRVERVVAINPYDYAAGLGISRSSLLAKFLFAVGGVPVLGPTVMRLRQLPIEQRIFRGGVTRDDSLPPVLVREMYQVGNRRGHNRGFRSLLRHAAGWEEARSEYAKIERPVLLIYGERDWSRPDEREANRRDIPGAEYLLVQGGGHFLSLDKPEAVIDALTRLIIPGTAESVAGSGRQPALTPRRSGQ